MTNPYRAMCAELTDAELANAARKALGEPSYATELHYFLSEDSNEYEPLMLAIRAAIAADRARALLAQPVAKGPKPMVDYSRVPEIATEAQIRSAAQYLVKKQNCDGDLIPAIKYAIARWGHPTPQPVAVSERLPGPEDCLDEGWAWFFNKRIGWRQAVLPVSPGYTHWLPANALPTPEAKP
jgi:hypothetical protein